MHNKWSKNGRTHTTRRYLVFLCALAFERKIFHWPISTKIKNISVRQKEPNLPNSCTKVILIICKNAMWVLFFISWCFREKRHYGLKIDHSNSVCKSQLLRAKKLSYNTLNAKLSLVPIKGPWEQFMNAFFFLVPPLQNDYSCEQENLTIATKQKRN